MTLTERAIPWRQLLAVTLMVGVVALTSYLLVSQTGLSRGTVLFVVPVLIAAARWGILPAITAAFLGAAASAFFFFPPLYTFWVSDPQEVVNLILYLIVAVVTGHLATQLRTQAHLAQKREIEMRDLYAFSRRLAAAFAVSDIHAAIEDHLANVMQHRVVLFPAARDEVSGAGARRDPDTVPLPVRRVVGNLSTGDARPAEGVTVADDNGNFWLVRAISPKTAEFGMIAVDLGKTSQRELEEHRAHINHVLADANATLERLGVGNAINEARMRSQTDQFREALIGSVSHELRTPLASILGAATVLSTAPAVAQDRKLSALANDVRDEAERLNHDIQNLLDATRISSNGVKPRNEWTDPADIINSAVERCRRRIGNRNLTLDVQHDLPVVFVDSALVQQALVQVFDNAAKYSPPQSHIAFSARAQHGDLVFEVRDEGIGLTEQEKNRLWDRFFRGERHINVTSGSGLGLWIAHAFVAANGGRIFAESPGVGRGTTISIELPVTQAAVAQFEGDTDE
ncbi:MAG: sensor histidine kinase [Pseudolabrys sp.]